MVLYFQAFSATAADDDYIGRTGSSYPPAAAANIGSGGRGDRGRGTHEARELPSAAAAATFFEPNLKRKKTKTSKQYWNN